MSLQNGLEENELTPETNAHDVAIVDQDCESRCLPTLDEIDVSVEGSEVEELSQSASAQA